MDPRMLPAQGRPMMQPLLRHPAPPHGTHVRCYYPYQFYPHPPPQAYVAYAPRMPTAQVSQPYVQHPQQPRFVYVQSSMAAPANSEYYPVPTGNVSQKNPLPPPPPREKKVLEIIDPKTRKNIIQSLHETPRGVEGSTRLENGGPESKPTSEELDISLTEAINRNFPGTSAATTSGHNLVQTPAAAATVIHNMPKVSTATAVGHNLVQTPAATVIHSMPKVSTAATAGHNLAQTPANVEEKTLRKKEDGGGGELASSIKQIPENIMQITKKQPERKPGLPSRNPPLGSISTRKGNASSPPFSNQGVSSMKSESISIQTSSPIRKPAESTAILLQEEVESPILGHINEGNSLAGEDFLSSTAKDISVCVDSKSAACSKSHRYTIEELNNFKNGPGVDKDPPRLKGPLLYKKLPSDVYRSLFDRNFKHDSSYDNNSSFDRSNSFSNKHPASNKRGFNEYRNEHNYNGRNRGGRESEEKPAMIRVNISKDIELKQAENAWIPPQMRPKVEATTAEEKRADLIKRFRGLLNKITAENFDHLANEARDPKLYKIEDLASLNAVIELLFEKSVIEPNFGPIYARLCKVLTDANVFQLTERDINGNDCKKSSNHWKSILITRCQVEFETYVNDQAILANILEQIQIATPETKEAGDEALYNYRYRAQGTIKFIGELYMQNLLTSRIICRCMDILLANVTEENIGRACNLLTTVGKSLEEDLIKDQKRNSQQNSRAIIPGFLKILDGLKKAECITTERVRFDIMNLIDLHHDKWVMREHARKNQTIPKTLEQLRAENKQHELKQQIALSEFEASHSRNSSYQNNSSGNRRNQKQQSGRHNQHQQNQQPMKHFYTQNHRQQQQNNSSNFDFSKIDKILPSNDRMSFAPQRGLWPRSASQQNPLPPAPPANAWARPLYSRSNIESSTAAPQNERAQQTTTVVKSRNPSPTSEYQSEYEDDFMIELSDDEDRTMTYFTQKLNAFINGKLNFSMATTDIKAIKLTDRIVAMVFNKMIDMKACDRDAFAEAIIDLLNEEVLCKQTTIGALKLLILLVPALIPDVPRVCTYIGDFIVKLHAAQLITINQVATLCTADFSKPIIEHLKANSPDAPATAAPAPPPPTKHLPRSASQQNPLPPAPAVNAWERPLYSRPNPESTTAAQQSARAQQTTTVIKSRNPSPTPEYPPEYEDDFMIELSDDEDKTMMSFTQKLNAFNNGKLTFSMTATDVKAMKLTDRILAMVFNKMIDMKATDREAFAEAFIDLLNKGVICKQTTIGALKLLIQLVPALIPDVPRVCTYISDFIVKLHAAELIMIDQVATLCTADYSKPIIEHLKANIPDAPAAAAPSVAVPSVAAPSVAAPKTFSTLPFADAVKIPTAPPAKAVNKKFTNLPFADAVKIPTAPRIAAATNATVATKTSTAAATKISTVAAVQGPNKEADRAVKPEKSIKIESKDLKNNNQAKPKSKANKKRDKRKAKTQTSKISEKDNSTKDSSSSSSAVEANSPPPKKLPEVPPPKEISTPVSLPESAMSSPPLSCDKCAVLKKVQYMMKKRSLEDIIKQLEMSNFSKTKSFIPELGAFLTKTYIKKSTKVTESYLLMQHFINNDSAKGAAFLDIITDLVEKDKLKSAFEAINEYNVVTTEVLMAWRKKKNPKEYSFLSSIFVMADEADKTESE